MKRGLASFLSALVMIHGVFFMGPAGADTLPVAASVASPSSASTTEIQYSVFLGGLRMVDATARLSGAPKTDQAETYQIDIAAESKGVLGLFYTWTSTLASQGQWREGGISPQSHDNINLSKGKRRFTHLAYGGDGTVVVTADPPSKTDGRTPILPADILNTVDPISAAFQVMHAIAAGQSCTLVAQVYDGRRRYNLSFEDKGIETLTASTEGFYNGVAHRCDMTFHPIGGFKKKDKSDNFWNSAKDSDAPPVISLWFAAPVLGGALVPVKVETDSDFGRALIQMTAARVF